MTPEQLQAGADEARKVSKQIDKNVEALKAHTMFVDQAIGMSVLAALFMGTARVLDAMAADDAAKPKSDRDQQLIDAVGQALERNTFI